MTGRGGAARQALGFLLVFLAVGAVAGVVWEWVWDPPLGLVFEDTWYLEPAGPDYAFSGTGWYVVVAIPAGMLTAFALAWARPGHALSSFAAIVVGSVLAGWVMFMVGHGLGPGDPQVLAAGKPDLTSLPSELTLAGVSGTPVPFTFSSSAFVAFPMGAMFASIYAYLVATGRGSDHLSRGRDHEG